MNNQKLISILQSRIAKRKSTIRKCQAFANGFKQGTTSYTYAHSVAADHGLKQKQDKQIMKALIDAERMLNTVCLGGL